MSMTNDELNFEMTRMFIRNVITGFDVQELTEERRTQYLTNVRRYVESLLDNHTQPTTPHAQDGFLKLRDFGGKEHAVPYRGVWTIEHLKTYIEKTYSILPEDQRLTVLADSYSSIA